MLQSFVMILREGFESILIVAIILSYLKTIRQTWLLPVVYAAIFVSLAISAGLGYILMIGVNQSLWEGVLGLVTIVMVASLVIHMWKKGSHMKRSIHAKLKQASSKTSKLAIAGGVFLFTALMISREGMETALMLLQVREGDVIAGILLGVASAAAMGWLWFRYSHLLNLKRFFQVTGLFLILFMVQVAIYSFHEFCEAGLFPNSERWHALTEPFSPVGSYGQWFSLAMLGVCAVWLVVASLRDRHHPSLSRQ